MLRDLYHNIKTEISIPPKAFQAKGNEQGGAIDLQGHHSAVVSFHFGAISNTVTAHKKIQVKLQHGEALNALADVSPKDLQGDCQEITDQSLQNKTYTVGYVGAKRYLRVVLTVTDDLGGDVFLSAIVTKSLGTHSPESE